MNRYLSPHENRVADALVRISDAKAGDIIEVDGDVLDDVIEAQHWLNVFRSRQDGGEVSMTTG